MLLSHVMRWPSGSIEVVTPESVFYFKVKTTLISKFAVGLDLLFSLYLLFPEISTSVSMPVTILMTVVCLQLTTSEEEILAVAVYGMEGGK